MIKVGDRVKITNESIYGKVTKKEWSSNSCDRYYTIIVQDDSTRVKTSDNVMKAQVQWG